jgi:hypothetical protein
MLMFAGIEAQSGCRSADVKTCMFFFRSGRVCCVWSGGTRNLLLVIFLLTSGFCVYSEVSVVEAKESRVSSLDFFT